MRLGLRLPPDIMSHDVEGCLAGAAHHSAKHYNVYWCRLLMAQQFTMFCLCLQVPGALDEKMPVTAIAAMNDGT